MKTSHTVIGAFMLWSFGLANMCLAQASAMGVSFAIFFKYLIVWQLNQNLSGSSILLNQCFVIL